MKGVAKLPSKALRGTKYWDANGCCHWQWVLREKPQHIKCPRHLQGGYKPGGGGAQVLRDANGCHHWQWALNVEPQHFKRPCQLQGGCEIGGEG